METSENDPASVEAATEPAGEVDTGPADVEMEIVEAPSVVPIAAQEQQQEQQQSDEVPAVENEQPVTPAAVQLVAAEPKEKVPLLANPPSLLRGMAQNFVRGIAPSVGTPGSIPGLGPGSAMHAPPPLLATPPAQPQELWVETKTAEGKSYYYHAITRETTWTRPEGLNVKVLSQAEVEAMNKPQTPQPKPLLELKLEQPIPSLMGVSVGNIPTTSAYQTAVTTASVHRFSGPPPAFMGGMPPFGMPPPSFPNFPPWNQAAAVAAAAAGGGPGQWPPGASPLMDPAKAIAEIKTNEIDPTIAAKAIAWTEHKAPDGRPYFYNASKGESVWEKPQAIKDMESK